MNKRVKKSLMTVLRAGVGYSVAFYFLNRLFDKDTFTAEVQNGSYPLFIIGLLGFALILIISFIRWQRLMDVVGVHLGFFTVLRLGMIGTFFNSSLPGAVSGDFVKMLYIRHHAPDKKAEAILTIFLDRVFGMFGLLIVAFIACLVNLDYLLNADRQIQLWTFGMGIASAGGVAAILALIFKDTAMKVPGVPRVVKVAERLLPERVLQIILRIIRALDLYRTQFSAVIVAVSLSALSHLIFAGVLMAIGHAIHIDGVSVTRYVLAMSMSNAVSSIPITPGSFGIRDTVSMVFLKEAGAPEAKAMVAPILVTCAMAFWSIVGGISYVIGLTGTNKDDLVADNEEDSALDNSL